MQQRRRPPWRRSQRSRSREERPAPTRREAREQEAADLRSNSHRPWRVTSSSSRVPDTAGAGGNTTGVRNRTGHPAMVDTGAGPENIGIHAWHCLTNMWDPMNTPEETEYGLGPDQRANVAQTFRDMTVHERLHMMVSFLRFLALLAQKLADIMEDVQNEGDEPGTRDDTSLMQRFLATKGSEGPHLFNTDFEMHLRALIAALEMSPPPVAQRRAQEIMERLNHMLDDGGVDRTDVEAQMLLSAMVTFVDDKLLGQGRPQTAQV